MPNGTEGVAKFFAGLGSGPALRQQAASQGRLDAMREALADAQIRSEGADAGIKQAKLDSLDPATLAQAFAGMGLDAGQSQGAAGLARAGNSAEQIAGLMKGLQLVGAQKAAQAAAVSGNKNLANANLFGATDKPVTLSQVTDGVALDPTATPDQNAFNPTAVGQSMIGAHNAAAANSYASARATTTKLPNELRLLGAQADKASKESNSTTSKLPPLTDLTNILPKAAPADDPEGKPVVNPADVASAFGWLAQHPGANVGDYVNQAPVGSPGASAPLGATPLSPTPAPDPSMIAGLLSHLGLGGAKAATASADLIDSTHPEAPVDSGPATPQSADEFAKLPKGALYLNPADGRVYRKK